MARKRGFGPLVDDSLYVRAYTGKSSRWYQASMQEKAGKITAAGLTKEVSFEPVIGSLNDRIMTRTERNIAAAHTLSR